MTPEDPRALDLCAVGLGQGGGNLAAEWRRRGYRSLLLNTARSDLRGLAREGGIDVPESLRLHIGIGTTDGAGKDPDYGAACLREHADLVKASIEEQMKGADALLLCAGLGGGTGSAVAELLRVIESLEIPTISVVTLPAHAESGITKVNAVRTANALVTAPLHGRVFIDNERLVEAFPEVDVVSYYPHVNARVLGPLDALNRLNARTDLYSIRSFDGEDMRKVLLSGGVLQTHIEKLDVTRAPSAADLIAVVERCVNGGQHLAPGLTLEQCAYLALVLVGPEKILKKTPIQVFDEAIAGVKERTQGGAVYEGLYVGNDDTPLEVYVLSASLALPARVVELLGAAQTEGRDLMRKIQEEIPELEISPLEGLDLFRSPARKASSTTRPAAPKPRPLGAQLMGGGLATIEPPPRPKIAAPVVAPPVVAPAVVAPPVVAPPVIAPPVVAPPAVAPAVVEPAPPVVEAKPAPVVETKPAPTSSAPSEPAAAKSSAPPSNTRGLIDLAKLSSAKSEVDGKPNLPPLDSNFSLSSEGSALDIPGLSQVDMEALDALALSEENAPVVSTTDVARPSARATPDEKTGVFKGDVKGAVPKIGTGRYDEEEAKKLEPTMQVEKSEAARLMGTVKPASKEGTERLPHPPKAQAVDQFMEPTIDVSLERRGEEPEPTLAIAKGDVDGPPPARPDEISLPEGRPVQARAIPRVGTGRWDEGDAVEQEPTEYRADLQGEVLVTDADQAPVVDRPAVPSRVVKRTGPRVIVDESAAGSTSQEEVAGGENGLFNPADLPFEYDIAGEAPGFELANSLTRPVEDDAILASVQAPDDDSDEPDTLASLRAPTAMSNLDDMLLSSIVGEAHRGPGTGLQNVYEDLIERFRQSVDRRGRERVARRLIDDSRAEDVELRALAVWAMVKLEEKGFRRALAKSASDENPEIAKLALTGLERIETRGRRG